MLLQTEHAQAARFPDSAPSRMAHPHEVDLLLQVENGPILGRFSPDVVQVLRHTTTRLAREQELPGSLALAAALREVGVTYIALAMATVTAHDTAQNVCFVDLNWHWPSAHLRVLHEQNRGIAAVLRGDLSLENALVHTTRPNLSLLPAGTASPMQRPVIARGAALRALLDQLSERYDHLLLDIPAVLATSDAIPLVSLGAGCCLVAGHGASTTLSVGRALDEISHMPILGMIMNRVRFTTPPWIFKWIPQE